MSYVAPVKIAVARETREGENRVAMVPELVGKLTGLGAEVVVEPDAGRGALIADQEYVDAGATIDAGALDDADVVVAVQPLPTESVRRLKKGAATFSFLPVNQEQRLSTELRDSGVTSFSMELVPRISRAQSMDALSSQALVSGYRCAIVAAGMLRRFFPLNMTAAGTVQPAEVVVLGAGVAGLQAIATAKRLGAVVRAYDVRAAAAEEIRSMGAKAIELKLETLEGAGGYAREMTEDRAARQRELLTPFIANADALITTAAVPGRQAPMLVTSADGRADEARLGRRRPGRRDRRQRRGLGAGEVVRIGKAQVWGGKNMPVPDARAGLAALRPERRQHPHPDDGAADERDQRRRLRARLRRRDRGRHCVTHDGAIPTNRPGRRSRATELKRTAEEPADVPAETPAEGAGDERPRPRQRDRLADVLRPQRLRRDRGDLEGVLHAAHAVDVWRERHPRHHLVGAILVTGTRTPTS